MNKLIDFIEEKHKEDVELFLKSEYSVHYGWTIRVFKKGYDTPIIEAHDNDYDKVTNMCYKMLKNAEV